MAAKKRRYLDLLLGLFVVCGFILLLAAVFIIGKERRLFETGTHVMAQFPDVAGLAVGAHVMLAGVYVGYVSSIDFPQIDEKKAPKRAGNVVVVMRVASDMMPWVRKDSIARIDAKGLLGDKIINISMGTAQAPALKGGAFLQSQPPVDLNQALVKVQGVLDNVAAGVESARKVLDGFVAAGGDVALARGAHALKNIADQVEKGGGIIHQLVYDKKAGQDFSMAVSGLNSSLAGVSALVHDVKKGDGLLHSLVYDPKGAQVVSDLKNVVGELDAIFKEVRDGNGIVHDLIYTNKHGELLDNLTLASTDLRSVMDRINKGEGTLGRLLVDPTIYEQLVGILRNVERNNVLKAIVRYGISKQEQEEKSK